MPSSSSILFGQRDYSTAKEALPQGGLAEIVAREATQIAAALRFEQDVDPETYVTLRVGTADIYVGGNEQKIPRQDGSSDMRCVLSIWAPQDANKNLSTVLERLHYRTTQTGK